MDNESKRDLNEVVAQLSAHITDIDRRLSEGISTMVVRPRSSLQETTSSVVPVDTHSIVRLGERIGFIEEKIKDVKDSVEKLIGGLDKYQEKANTLYVLKTDFEPIRKLVYGAVGFILVTVLSAFMLLVVKSNTAEYKIITETKPPAAVTSGK